MDFNLGFLSKNKDKHEVRQTDEVKLATISDTQTNSMGQMQQNQPAYNSPIDNQQAFVNPFADSSSQQNFDNIGIDNNNFVPSFAQDNTQLPSSNFNQNGGQMQEQELAQINPFGNQNNQTGNDMYSNQFGSNQMQQQQQQGQENLTQMEMNSHNQIDQGQFSQNEQNQNSNFNQDQNNSFNKVSQGMDKDQIIEMIDETVEKIIEEKWNELVNSVNKIGKWKDKTESVIEMMKEDIVAIRDGFGKLEGKIINKINSYDKDIMDVSSEIKALEKVFQKITPTLINNVNELSKIADEFKGIKTKEKKNENYQEKEDNNRRIN